MVGVRHFLGFAEDSNARVGRAACWRRLVMLVVEISCGW